MATTSQALTEPALMDKSTYATRGWVVVMTASLFFFYEFIQLNLFNAIDVQLMQAFNLTCSLP